MLRSYSAPVKPSVSAQAHYWLPRQAGDTLALIFKRYDVSVKQVKVWKTQIAAAPRAAPHAVPDMIADAN